MTLVEIVLLVVALAATAAASFFFAKARHPKHPTALSKVDVPAAKTVKPPVASAAGSPVARAARAEVASSNPTTVAAAIIGVPLTSVQPEHLGVSRDRSTARVGFDHKQMTLPVAPSAVKVERAKRNAPEVLAMVAKNEQRVRAFVSTNGMCMDAWDARGRTSSVDPAYRIFAVELCQALRTLCGCGRQGTYVAAKILKIADSTLYKWAKEMPPLSPTAAFIRAKKEILTSFRSRDKMSLLGAAQSNAARLPGAHYAQGVRKFALELVQHLVPHVTSPVTAEGVVCSLMQIDRDMLTRWAEIEKESTRNSAIQPSLALRN